MCDLEIQAREGLVHPGTEYFPIHQTCLSSTLPHAGRQGDEFGVLSGLSLSLLLHWIPPELGRCLFTPQGSCRRAPCQVPVHRATDVENLCNHYVNPSAWQLEAVAAVHHLNAGLWWTHLRGSTYSDAQACVRQLKSVLPATGPL